MPSTMIRPTYYKQGKVECIDAIASAVENLQGMDAFCTGNCIKYLFRWKQKNGVEDLTKSSYYLNYLIEKEKEKEKENGEKA